MEFDLFFLKGQSLPGEFPFRLGQSFAGDIGHRYDFPFLDDTGRNDRAGEKDDQQEEQELTVSQGLFWRHCLGTTLFVHSNS
jgi:hypothetical protein